MRIASVVVLASAATLVYAGVGGPPVDLLEGCLLYTSPSPRD